MEAANDGEGCREGRAGRGSGGGVWAVGRVEHLDADMADQIRVAKKSTVRIETRPGCGEGKRGEAFLGLLDQPGFNDC